MLETLFEQRWKICKKNKLINGCTVFKNNVLRNFGVL